MSLDYANFVFDSSFCNQTKNEKYCLIYRKTIKKSFSLSKQTPETFLYQILLLPSPQQLISRKTITTTQKLLYIPSLHTPESIHQLVQKNLTFLRLINPNQSTAEFKKQMIK